MLYNVTTGRYKCRLGFYRYALAKNWSPTNNFNRRQLPWQTVFILQDKDAKGNWYVYNKGLTHIGQVLYYGITNKFDELKSQLNLAGGKEQ